MTVATCCLNVTINQQSNILCCQNGSYSQVFGETIAFSKKVPQICKERNEIPDLKVTAPDSNNTRNGIMVLCILILGIGGYIIYKYAIYRCKRRNIDVTIKQSSPNQEIEDTAV